MKQLKQITSIAIPAVLIAALCSPCFGAAARKDIPVAPIEYSTYNGWTQACRLSTSDLDVVVVPEIGRIAHLSWKGKENLYRQAPHVDGNANAWQNYGGNWIWPVAQANWPLFQEGEWPPSKLLDGRPWTGRAWKDADGSQCCLLKQEYGAPLNIEVSRHIKVLADKPVIEIRQRLQRTGPSEVPVTLWTISQIDHAETVFFPLDAEAPKLTPLQFAPPPSTHLVRCTNYWVYDAKKEGETKLGSASDQRWIAALKDNTLIVESTLNGHLKGPYPDKDSRVTMYSNSGLGYTEIETLSVEKKHLIEGENIENLLRIELFHVEGTNTICSFGEIPGTFRAQD